MSQTAFGARRPHVLLIDDSSVALAAIAAALKSICRVTARSDPARVEWTALDAVDLILLDVHLPDFYGDDAVEYLREVKQVSAPIVLLSSLAEAELRVRAGRVCADGYLSKDIGAEAIAAHVHKLLQPSS
jgi:DNA-binding response OmpR family regulator